MLFFAIYYKCFVVLCNQWVELFYYYIELSISSAFLYCHGCQIWKFQNPPLVASQI